MQDRNNNRTTALELWGGYECTVNRVQDGWYDQTLFGGHQHRLADLALFAGLGVRSLRYPALWERMSPDDPDQCDFCWTDERLPELQRLGIDPILTLCHHGSGPHYTDLLQDSFATGLARHAAAVARRYPWVRDWTPVNEPLTTARFSALYGYWYPHTVDEGLFWRALVNEIDATRLSMHAIRAVNPDARLVQTDDLGYCHATEPLKCEADFQNQRRWMGWDLLCGMVVPGHPLWERLCAFGLEDRLRAIADDPCPPDIIGINHYLSSERLLDHRIALYPNRSVADKDLGNCAGVAYVDIDAVRHMKEPPLGLPALLQQAWERYHLPIAVTECHNGATRDEQVRWFVEVWQNAQELRAGGMDLRAVTAWALLGSYDWNRMVTRFAGHYEPGVFDVRSGEPRPTLMARVLRRLAHGQPVHVPPLHAKGWWRRARLGEPRRQRYEMRPEDRIPDGPQPLLIVGDDGPLTHLAVRACETRALHYVRNTGELAASIRGLQPWAVLDTRDREGLAGPRLRDPDALGARSSVAQICAREQVPCALFTSAFGPGLAAEALSLPGVLVARTGPVFTPWDAQAEPVRWIDALESGGSAEIDGHAHWHSVYGPDLLDGVLDLLLDGAEGGLNFVPRERISAGEFARQLAVHVDCDASRVVVTSGAQSAPEGDIHHVSFLPPTETTLERFVRERRLARTEGEQGVQRRDDEVRMEDAG
ncbi:MAG TPA: family 1 glycosylhydrolase [Ramlibacter sp.]|jgi:dTDP-4-dehydrorhamnose reductase|nr:family 1 glycosylhydrolase [Ramlibacter sp.]